MGPVSARFSLSERQTLARSTFLSRISTRFRHNACDTQPLLSEPPFVIPSGCAVPSLKSTDVITEYCIGAVGPVRTVVLLSDGPVSEVRRVFLDPHSQTSVQLVGYSGRPS